jgi:competence protein ComEA
MIIAPFIFGLTLTALCAVTDLPRVAQESAHSSFSAISLEQGDAAPAPPLQSEERININTASATELTRLPGVGPTLAASIIEHRRKHGPFKRPQDIIIVRRVSAKLYRQIAHLIRI